jgi:hypothetical protein
MESFHGDHASSQKGQNTEHSSVYSHIGRVAEMDEREVGSSSIWVPPYGVGGSATLASDRRSNE